MSESTMSRRDRLRRVVILCRNFAANLAYYRVGRRAEHLPLQDYTHNAKASFWRIVSANFIDTCVLEWCKLFADPNGKHHWSKIVSAPDDYKTLMMMDLGLDDAAFQEEIAAMKHYRDKFLAHLDSEEIMKIPILDTAKKAVWFYHSYIVRREAQSDDLVGLPLELEPGYALCEKEAQEIYRRNT